VLAPSTSVEVLRDQLGDGGGRLGLVAELGAQDLSPGPASCRRFRRRFRRRKQEGTQRSPTTAVLDELGLTDLVTN